MSDLASLSDEPGPDIRSDEARAALARLLDHSDFGASQKRRAFLAFVVEETLAGRGGALKGFTIAEAVFGRDETFDPRSDPVVRLEARRLRRDLDSFYMGPGADEPLRITIPKGAYTPRFERRVEVVAETPATPEPGAAQPARHVPHATRIGSWGARGLLGAMLILAFGAVAALSVWLVRGSAAAPVGPPHVAILPFQALDASETSRVLAHGLGTQLVRDLGRFQWLKLYQPPAGADTPQVIATLARSEPLAFVVRGEVVSDGETRMSASVQILDARSNEVVWTESYAGRPRGLGLIDARADLAGRLASAIGQPYGPLFDETRARLQLEDPRRANPYTCLIEAYHYRRSFSAEARPQVMDCLGEAVRADPEDAEAWAMLGWIHVDEARYEETDRSATDISFDRAVAAAERAVRLSPNSLLALKALAAVRHHSGDMEGAVRLMRRARAVNPNDPGTMAQLGWRLAIRGDFEAGIPLLEEAIGRSINPPGWYFDLICLHHLMRGEYLAMRAAADRAAQTGPGFSDLLLAISSAGIADLDATREALERLADWPDASAPGHFLYRHGATDEIVTVVEAGLAEARRFVAASGG